MSGQELAQEALNGNLQRVKDLLAQGVSADSEDSDGFPALVNAGFKGHTAVAEALLTARANVHVTDPNGNTALILAGINGQTATAQALLAAGAHTEAKNKEGNTALILAGCFGHRAIAQALLAAGAHIEAKDNLGDTALTLAGYNGQTATAEVLLAAGANIDHKGDEGKTALEWAREKGHHETAKMLEEAAKMTPQQRKDQWGKFLIETAEEEKKAATETGFSAARDAALALRRRLDEEHSPFQCERLGAELDGLIERALQTRCTEHQEQKRSLEQQLAALERKVTALKTELAEADAQLDLDSATMQSVGGEALQALLAAKHEAFSQRWRQWSEEEVADWVGSLEQGRFAQLVACFRENGIDGKELAALENMTNLTDCGVKRMPDRRALWVHLQPLLGLDAAGRSDSKEVAPQAIPERPAAPVDCAVCMDRPVEVVFAPCGHRCCCAECATELRQGGQSCPICRVKIESVVQRVFD
eukprot:g72662.t1